MSGMISYYNTQVGQYVEVCKNNAKKPNIEKFIDNNPQKISWSRRLKNDLGRFALHEFKSNLVVPGLYRPFCKQWAYFDENFNDFSGQMPKIFPQTGQDNLMIYLSGVGASKGFSALITSLVPNLHFHDTGQGFPLYVYDKVQNSESLFESERSVEYIKKDNIPDSILNKFRTIYDVKVCKEDIFYYVYGILHSPEYKERFASDLKKMLPRIPLVQDFWAFSKAGRELAEWHLNYETVETYPLQEQTSLMGTNTKNDYKVSKMRFGKQGSKVDKTTIIYNSHITLHGIPLEAYDYIVNGKSALEWIMERYQTTTDKDSLITNDPNDWSDDPQYILNLVKRIVRVSIETIKIVKALPALNEGALYFLDN